MAKGEITATQGATLSEAEQVFRKDLMTNVKELNEQVRSYKMEMDSLKKSNSDLQEKVECLTDTNIALKEDVVNLTKALEKFNGEATTLTCTTKTHSKRTGGSK